ncbi:13001_t:CDS:2, partial [Rhizophagus irregularis]
ILNDSNSYKLKGQRILTYNELSRQFQSNYRLQRAQIDPRLSRTCNGFANLSNSLTRIMSNWFIIEEHPESDDNETKVQMLKILSNYLLNDHVNRGTLLTELVKEIENELDKESQYNRIKDYYGANPSNGLPSTYDTIFKDIDSVLKDFLAPIPLSLQRAQMKQALLYQGTLVPIEQINESDEELGNIIEHIYDRPQIRLRELLIDIDEKEIQEIWEVNYIAASSSTKPHYVVIFGDMTLLCTSVFHMGFIHTRWFGSILPETNNYITINQGTTTYTTNSLQYINQMRTANTYTSIIRENCITMSVAKTSVQIAISEGVTSELTGLLKNLLQNT